MPGRKRVTKGRRNGNDSSVRSPTSTSSDVRSPTSTKTATHAYTSGNVTVTGGAGRGANTSVHIHPKGNKGHHKRKNGSMRVGLPFALSAAKRNPAKRNPEALAAEAYRDFHGKEPAKVITVDTPRHYHGVLAGIGKLDFVSFHRPEGRAKGIKFTAGTYLAENEKRTQLFITGGDQSVNLRDFGISKPHESEILGEVSEIGYRTEKLHLIEKDGGKGLYVHKFGTPRPTLIYDTRNKLLSFAGGGYTIPSEGIDG